MVMRLRSFIWYLKVNYNIPRKTRYSTELKTKLVLEVLKDRAIDNICIEIFWRSAKCERIYLNEYNSIKELRDDISDLMIIKNLLRLEHQLVNFERN